jgi:hypothetical protein
MRWFAQPAALVASCAFSIAACGGSEGAPSSPLDGSTSDAPAQASPADAARGPVDGGDGSTDDVTAERGADDAASDGGPVDASEGGLPADRFVTGVVSFTPGPCAGFGQSRMPGVVEGPPHGGGASMGGLDVVSLGVGGEIVLSFAPDAIVDGPGVDFIVFENPFYVGGNPQDLYAEPGEVSVSDDGSTWLTYPCTATSYPYGQCAGWHPVLSSPGNGISPVDPATAGGDPYDLGDLGLTRVRYVRIRDRSGETCPDAGGTTSAGFDLDAISIVNAQTP